MKIIVKSRKYVESNLTFLTERCNVISIFSSIAEDAKCFSPFKDNSSNILKLQFDDLTFEDLNNSIDKSESYAGFIFFNEELAKEIHKWIDSIDRTKTLVIHCDAGISRSGAIGSILNEYFNKFKEFNIEDNDFFNKENKSIAPNNLVSSILKNELFGITDYSSIFK